MKGYMVMVQAGCHDCDWSSLARNAMGNAARHAKVHGHTTWVESTVEFGAWTASARAGSSAEDTP